MPNVFEFVLRAKDDFSDTVGDLDRSLGDLKGTIAGVAGAGAGFVLTGHLEDSTVSLGELRAQLGLTESETRELGSVARDVYSNNFGGSIGEATQVTGLLHQALGTTGGALRDATEDVFRITDAFGHLGAEPDIIAENVRVMKAAFPDMSDAEILDTIAKAFQDGAGRSGDLQDSLQEYPRFFSEIGLSAQDMRNFMTEGMEAGARNSDLLGDAVKEMGIIVQEEGSKGQEAIAGMFGADQADELIKNFSAGGEAGRDAFFKILEGLNELEDPIERNQAAIDLFGTKGEDLAGVLDDMLPSFLATKDASQELGDATGSLDAQYVGTGNTIEGLKRRFEGLIAGPMGDFGPAAGEALTAVGGLGTGLAGLQAMGVNVGGMVSGLGGKMLAAIAPTNLMAGAQAALNLVMSLNPILLVVLALAALVGGLVLAYQNSETFRDIVNGVWSSIRETVQPVLDFLVREIPAGFRWILDFVSENWPLIIAIVGGPLGIIVGLVIENWDTIKSTVDTGVRFVKDVVGTVLGELKADWDTVWGGIKSAIDTIWNGAGGVVLTVDLGINKIRGYIEDILGGIEKTWETIWGNISGFVSSTWDGIESRIRGGVNSVIGAINHVLSAISELEINIPGFDSGIPGVPSFAGITIGVPDIPLLPLLNMGGLILKTGLAIVHEGETIVPAEHTPLSSSGIGLAGGGGGGSGGGTPVIQGALQLPAGIPLSGGQRYRLSGLTSKLGVDFVFSYLRDGFGQDPPRSVETMVRELEELASGDSGASSAMHIRRNRGGFARGRRHSAGGASIVVQNFLDADLISTKVSGHVTQFVPTSMVKA